MDLLGDDQFSFPKTDSASPYLVKVDDGKVAIREKTDVLVKLDDDDDEADDEVITRIVIDEADGIFMPQMTVKEESSQTGGEIFTPDEKRASPPPEDQVKTEVILERDDMLLLPQLDVCEKKDQEINEGGTEADMNGSGLSVDLGHDQEAKSTDSKNSKETKESKDNKGGKEVKRPMWRKRLQDSELKLSSKKGDKGNTEADVGGSALSAPAASESDTKSTKSADGKDIKDSKVSRDIKKLTLRKRSKDLDAKADKDKNDPSRFLGDGVSFKAKLIGVLEVNEARGDRMCQDALAELKMAIKAAGEHKQRVNINVAIDGLRIRDEKTGDCQYHHPVHKISFIAQDMTDNRAFGYIFGSPDSGHKFFGIKTEKAASQVVIAMRDLFQVVFELKKKEIEKAKQQLEHTHSSKFGSGIGKSDDIDKKELSKIPETSSGKIETIKEEPSENGEIGAMAKPSEQSGAITDLLDLEFELNSIQQGINQMDRITPSDPFGPVSNMKDPFFQDPFGDSFKPNVTSTFTPKVRSTVTSSTPSTKETVKDPFNTMPFIPPPPSSAASKKMAHSATKNKSPLFPDNKKGPFANGSSTSDIYTSPKTDLFVPSPADQAGLGGLSSDRYAVFKDLTPPVSEGVNGWPGTAHPPETPPSVGTLEIPSPPVTTQEQVLQVQPPAPLQPQQQAQATGTSSTVMDLFTDLDPLGTGRNKPYVDKKNFFQELKNPPKKILKDLVGDREQSKSPERGLGAQTQGVLGEVGGTASEPGHQ